MKKIPKKYLISGSMAILGLLGGFLYWRFVGCRSGSCPITSNWHLSSLAGGLIGYLAGDSFNDLLKKKENREGPVHPA
jgi:hypothetical protein